MNYPLISEYIDSIMCAEDNFATLTNLRPVLDNEGKPVMNSGNFAVVFKMKDITNKKLYAIKCFIKEQVGRSHAYKVISEELSKEDSKHIANFQYLEDELFVALSGGGEIEVPVVKMEWIEGLPLDKYIEKHINDSFSLTYLAYQFVQFTSWLLSRDFAHGDLKPDNLLVDSECTIVMIDYDGMFMPSFESNVVNEVGSPDYQHPSRTLQTFSKDIDDFSLLVILIEILYSNIHKEACLPIFSRKDFNSITESIKLKQIFPSVNVAFNTAITELVNSLLGNHLSISHETFIKLKRIIDNAYYEASNTEYRRQKEICKEKGHSIWYYYSGNRNRGYRGNIKNYPVMPSIYVEGYDYEHDGYPCIEKDGCLLHVSDSDGGSYMGDCWDEDWDLIVAPDNIVTISDEAFYGCNYVRFIVLPNTVKSIGNKAFNCCASLQYIVLPEKLERARGDLLNLWPNDYIKSKGCTNLDLLKQFENDIVIPCVKQEGRRISFRNCKWSRLPHEYIDILKIYNECCLNFKNFIVPNGSKNYYQNLLPEYKDYIIDFSDFVNSDDVEVNPLTACIAEKIVTNNSKIIKYNGDEETYCIPSSVKTICSHAFAGNEKLKKVVIPESITSLGNSVFRDCKNLESITLPHTMTSIPTGFLHGCEKLKELILPPNIRYIGCDAFGYCKSLEKIQIPCSVTYIGANAFSHCESLKSIVLPSTVTEIGNNAFWDCKELVSVTLPERMAKIGGDLFKDCKSLLAIEIPKGITSIPTYCFYGCKSLRYVSLPNTIESISNEAFSRCTNLNSIAFPTSLKNISWGAFSECGLRTVRLPENIEIIEYSAFKNCAKLCSVEIPSSIKLRKIEKFVFEGCESLTGINIPDCIEEIEGWGFSGCKLLRKITLPSHIQKIENGLFSGCVNLEQVHNISNIVSIGQEAFFRCISLKHLVLPSLLKEIGHNSLCGVNINNIEIHSPYFEKDNVAVYTKGKKGLIAVLKVPTNWNIPETVEEIREWAFNGCRISKLVIPNSVKELCKDAFYGCIIDRIEINRMIIVHPFTFSKGVKEIAVPKQLISYYKRAVLTPNGNNLYDIDKKFICLE